MPKIFECFPSYILERQEIRLLKDRKDLSKIKIPKNYIETLEFFMKVRLPFITFNPYQIEKKERKTMRINHDEIKRSGLVIISIKPKFAWKKYQHTEYRLVRENQVPIKAYIKISIPSNHYVEFDVINKQFRLVGRNVKNREGDWL